MSPTALWTITLLLLFGGLIGTVVPGLPGIGFVYAGILVYAFATDFAVISVPITVGLGVVSIVALLTSYIGSLIGSRAGGGGKKALAGTLLGTLIGMLLGPIGMFIGAFLGALAGAMLEGGTRQQALKIAFYSVIGMIGSSVIQFFLALIMIATFFVVVFF
jgi:uncharacterized protein YqgC (DUF456 family)